MTISNITHNIILGIKYECMALGMGVNIFYTCSTYRYNI